MQDEVIKLQLKQISDDVKDIKLQLKTDYVTQEQLRSLKGEVKLLKSIVFGFVSLILTAVVGGRMILLYK